MLYCQLGYWSPQNHIELKMEHNIKLSEISEKTGMDVSAVGNLMKEFAAVLARECADMNRVAIPGFGAFEGVKHDEEIREDLSTGNKILYPPMIEVKFTPGAMLKKRFN